MLVGFSSTRLAQANRQVWGSAIDELQGDGTQIASLSLPVNLSHGAQTLLADPAFPSRSPEEEANYRRPDHGGQSADRHCHIHRGPLEIIECKNEQCSDECGGRKQAPMFGPTSIRAPCGTARPAQSLR
jgi:hypothetical protein